MRMNLSITSLPPGGAAACERLLRSLPDWFGIEEAIVHYASVLETYETSVAMAGDEIDEIAGFITIKRHNPFAAEIYVIAVKQALHRHGIGRRLVAHAERRLRAESVEQVRLSPFPAERALRGHAPLLRASLPAARESAAIWGP
jgi:GNAT superfamily N-acetyltransferase